MIENEREKEREGERERERERVRESEEGERLCTRDIETPQREMYEGIEYRVCQNIKA